MNYIGKTQRELNDSEQLFFTRNDKHEQKAVNFISTYTAFSIRHTEFGCFVAMIQENGLVRFTDDKKQALGIGLTPIAIRRVGQSDELYIIAASRFPCGKTDWVSKKKNKKTSCTCRSVALKILQFHLLLTKTIAYSSFPNKVPHMGP